MESFDIGIIGAGVAGAFACLKIAKENKNLKTILFDLGRPPGKRRRQLEGWLGCFPNSDGKLYISDLEKVAKLSNKKKINSANKFVMNSIDEVIKSKIIEDKLPQKNLLSRLSKLEFDITLNNYIQMYPKDIHSLSKMMNDIIEENKNVTFSFDNEVYKIYKEKDNFIIATEQQEYSCKRILLCAGRSGWRWVKDIYKNFGIIENNDFARYGVYAEMPAPCMKEFNKSNCTLTKGDLEIGPFSWNGTIIPEDHVDLAICAFRSNENRWHTDKVCFQIVGNQPYQDNGCEQTDRIGKLTFVLANERLVREKLSALANNKSKTSVMSEYHWLSDVVKSLSEAIPELLNRGYFHVPAIIPLPPKIKIGDNLSTEVDGMFVAGESAGISGILSAAVMGSIAATEITK